MRIKGKRKREALKKIKSFIEKGYSANRIQKELKKLNLGVRRKVLLEEIRTIRKIEITTEKRKKSIPKKYREPEIIIPPKKITELFRVSYIIPSIPVHSRPFKRRYLGFRLNAFSLNRNKLLNNHDRLKTLLIKLTSEYLGSDVTEWNQWDVSVGREFPVIVFVSKNLNDMWFFAVEDEGKEIYSRSGYI